jgi:SAM-dependent methyltransferase
MRLAIDNLYGYGDFGNLSKNYNKGRQGFPKEVIDYFWSLAEVNKPVVLDIGCGTGIATRQLACSGAKMFGIDIDLDMVSSGRRRRSSNITYFVCPSNRLPFEDERFDAITAFSAFHWFCDDESVGEIRRVLKKGGTFFVVNKNDAGNFKERYKAVLQPFICGEMPNSKNGYSANEILQRHAFSDIEEKRFVKSEFLGLPQALAYLQSVSIWNLVQQERKPEALKAIECFCKEKLEHNRIERKLEIVVVAGRK